MITLWYLIMGIMIGAVTCDDLVRLTKIRAKGDYMEGEVEIHFQGEWRPLCARLWAFADANVVCKSIGFEDGAAGNTVNDLFGEIKRRHYIFFYAGLACGERSNSLTECLNWKNAMMLENCAHGIAKAVCKR